MPTWNFLCGRELESNTDVLAVLHRKVALDCDFTTSVLTPLVSFQTVLMGGGYSTVGFTALMLSKRVFFLLLKYIDMSQFAVTLLVSKLSIWALLSEQPHKRDKSDCPFLLLSAVNYTQLKYGTLYLSAGLFNIP